MSEYNKLTDIPYKCVDLVFFTSVNYIKLNYSENDIHFFHYNYCLPLNNFIPICNF